MSRGVSTVDALQTTLAAEHAAVFAFGVLGGRAATLAQPAFTSALARAYDVHVTRRDQLRATIAALAATPVAAEPAYRLPRVLTSAGQLTREALRVERACTKTYAALVAATVGDDRSWAVDALVAGAAAELAFGGEPRPLPGVQAAEKASASPGT